MKTKKAKNSIFFILLATLAISVLFLACNQPTDNSPNGPKRQPECPISVDKFVAIPYTSTGNDKIKYSFTYDDYDFYYIYLGELKNIPIFYQTAHYHRGIDWTYTFTVTESVTNSISKIVTENS